MQEFYQLSAIDPSLLDLHTHTGDPSYNSNTAPASDDVAIATGQAGYDEANDDDVKAWSSSYNHQWLIDDFELLAEPQLCSSQPESVSEGAWESGGPDPGGLSRYAYMLPASAPGPETLLKTSAPGASSAPGLIYTSSQYYQNGLRSSLPPLDPSSAVNPSLLSQNHRHVSPMQQRLLHESHQTPSALSNSFPSPYDQAVHQRQEIPRASRLSRELDAGEKPWGGEESEKPRVSSCRQDEEPTAESLTSSTTAPIAIPRRSDSENLVAINAGYSIGYTLPSYHENINRRQDRKSWQKLHPGDWDSLTGVEPSWQQQQTLDWGPGQIHGPTAPRLKRSIRNPYIDGDYCISHSLDSAMPRNGFCQTDDDPSAHDHPGAINIPGSNRRCQNDQPSSFPTCLPIYTPDVSKPQRQQSAISTSPPTTSLLSGTCIPQRSKSNRNKSTRTSRSGSLKAIAENGHGILGSSPTGPARGRRSKPLDRATALAAGQKRFNGDVCIKCKMMKQTCKGSLPCQGCQRNSNAKSWRQPCHPAKFVDMVEAGPCNAVFQGSANVPTTHGSGTLTLNYSSDIDVKVLMRRLHILQFQYNIGVRQFSGSSYTLDLAKMVEIMSRLSKVRQLELYKLDHLDRHSLPQGSDWLDCILDYNPPVDAIGRSIESNDMPSANAYSYLPLDGTAPRLMNVDNEQNKSDLLLAIHLCRIIVLALEINAFRILQKLINDLPKNRSSEADMIHLAQQLSKLLFSLRWRVSWWAVFGFGSSTHNSGDTYTERVTMLTQSLYYWYFVVKKKLPAWTGPSSNGVHGLYAYDDLPEDESREGFHAWMAHGVSLMYEEPTPAATVFPSALRSGI